ncbi:MAG: TraC family protein, partial [Candidatus Gastranaerophilales bacterium]|nr:TraC family protein [Candidatus Gastranaerophilales bacterium]
MSSGNIALILILTGIAYVSYSLVDKKTIIKIANAIKDFFLPVDLTASPDAFTKTQMQALADKRTISRLLFYRSYLKDDESDLGFFQMHDGRIGIAFKITPPVYLTESTESVILNVLSAIVKDDTVVHISMLAGRDIKSILDSYASTIHCEKANVKFPEKLKEIALRRSSSFQEWTENSIMGDDADFRVRNFTHVLSVLFPRGLKKESILKQSNEIFGILKENFNAVIADDDDLVAFVQEILNPSRGSYDKNGDPITTISKRMSRGAQVEASDDESGILKLKDGWMAKVLTTNKYPKEVDAFGYQSIFFSPMGGDFQMKLPCPFFLSLTVRFKDVEAQRKKVLAKAEWNIGQLSALPMIIEKKKPEIKERRKEAESVIHYINYLGEFPLD